MGTDGGPLPMAQGIAAALGADQGVECVVVASEGALTESADVLASGGARLRTCVTPEHVIMSDDPVVAVQTKRRSSMSLAMRMVRDGTAHAAVTAGNTGAAVVAAAAIVQRSAGVTHPALATVVRPPGRPPTVLVDCGATTTRETRWLVEFAHLGSGLAHHLGLSDTPSVGLLANGVEETKGDSAIREAHCRLVQSPLRYVGLVEPDAFYAPTPDVVVTDGLLGNVLLKTIEATWRALRQQSTGPQGTGSTELDGRRARPTPRGAILLGVQGTVVKAHGVGTASHAADAVLFAATCARSGVGRSSARPIDGGRESG